MVDMDHTAVAIALCLLGVFLGSFTGASVWRVRKRQLKQDVKDGYKVSETAQRQVEKLKSKSIAKDRSVCLHCGHALHWYDLVPIFSWIYLDGRCRYCGKKIGNMEPLIEISMGLFFLLSYVLWPGTLNTVVDYIHLAVWLVAGVILIGLFVYDTKWKLLPNVAVWPLVGLGAVSSGIALYRNDFDISSVISILSGVLVLSGLYFVLHRASGGKYVGFGDVKLGLALALLLADARLAFLTLFLANLIGVIVILPGLIRRKVGMKSQVAFGPLLIAAYFISGIFGADIINFYLIYTMG